ncbi:MAG: EscN/YscN/HrcN family type III secretion system ATPase, partial [Kofleriaceae bacterium]|nr:EscN/YscN/HrcN family type III secretion system ATPase [Kofleriaceae bacterium]
ATPAQQAAAAVVRRHLAIHEEHRDLLAVGAYKPGGDRALDQAVARMPGIDAFLQQPSATAVPLSAAVDALLALAAK